MIVQILAHVSLCACFDACLLASEGGGGEGWGSADILLVAVFFSDTPILSISGCVFILYIFFAMSRAERYHACGGDREEYPINHRVCEPIEETERSVQWPQAGYRDLQVSVADV